MLKSYLLNKWFLTIFFLLLLFGYITLGGFFPKASASVIASSFPLPWAIFLGMLILLIVVLSSSVYAVLENIGSGGRPADECQSDEGPR